MGSYIVGAGDWRVGVTATLALIVLVYAVTWLVDGWIGHPAGYRGG